ncbi:TPA: glutathione s-transferase [Trebouxia sp. C0005]|nr:MAG: dehydroascorbate reductase [Trebouxia sp. A1-2]
MFLQQISSRTSCAELWCRPACLCPPFSAIDRRSASGTSRRCRTLRTMAVQLGYEAWVKGDPKTETLGDCPFCHRALLTLEEKHAKYTQDYVDFAEKPEWLLKINPEGSVPVVKDRETEEWFVDSAKFVDYLEDKHPEPALGKSTDAPDAGSKVFPAFVAIIKSPEGDNSKIEPLKEELKVLNSHLESHGPYLKGKDISAGDLALAPKLHHMQVALKAFKGFDIPQDMKAVHVYLDNIRSRSSWQNTSYSDDVLLSGWKPKLGSG